MGVIGGNGILVGGMRQIGALWVLGSLTFFGVTLTLALSLRERGFVGWVWGRWMWARVDWCGFLPSQE